MHDHPSQNSREVVVVLPLGLCTRAGLVLDLEGIDCILIVFLLLMFLNGGRQGAFIMVIKGGGWL